MSVRPNASSLPSLLPSFLLSPGVVWYKGAWQAVIPIRDISQDLGTYATEEEAARAYDRAAQAIYEYPVLNFGAPGAEPSSKRRMSHLFWG